MKSFITFLTSAIIATTCIAAEQQWISFEGGNGPGKGKHIVMLTGDEEYRSEESMPLMAKILSERHGFKCTVLFAVDPKDGTINPSVLNNIPGIEALDTADLCILALRFRAYPDEQMKHFDAYYKAGKPFIGVRTSTHAFKFPAGSAYEAYNLFGKKVLGEDWVSHWGNHKSEATRAVTEVGAEKSPILRGVVDVFGNTDVYEAYPPADSKILLRGLVLTGMKPDDAPADYKKARATDKMEQAVNDPPMPVTWLREHKNEAGTTNRVLTTTMGSATDLENEGMRRVLVNGVYHLLGMEVPDKADVSFVGDFKATMYGFNEHKKGVKPADLAKKK
jgi:hypothetical protein